MSRPGGLYERPRSVRWRRFRRRHHHWDGPRVVACSGGGLQTRRARRRRGRGLSAGLTGPPVPPGRRVSVNPCSIPNEPAAYHSRKRPRSYTNTTRFARALTDATPGRPNRPPRPSPISVKDSDTPLARKSAPRAPNRACTPPPRNRYPDPEGTAANRESPEPSAVEIADWAPTGSHSRRWNDANATPAAPATTNATSRRAHRPSTKPRPSENSRAPPERPP